MCIFRGAREEAAVIIGVLRSREVDAIISSDDADGWYPHVGFAQGTRVLVRSSDEEFARRVLIDAEPLPG